MALGALAMAVLITFEPFLQATIDYDGRLGTPLVLGSTAPATIGRSAVLDIGRYAVDPVQSFARANYSLAERSQLLISHYWSRADVGLTGSVFAGFGNITAANMQPAFTCASGNCTWTPYTSLGVCSRCNDVGSSIRTSRGEADYCSYDWPNCTSPVTIVWKNLHNMWNGQEREPYTRHFLGTPGANLSLSNWHGDYDGGACPECQDATLVAAVVASPDLTLSLRDLSTMIVGWTYLQADASFAAGRTVWEDTPVTARECGLYFCAQALRSRVDRGELREEVLGTWATRRPPPVNDSAPLLFRYDNEARFSNASLMDWLLALDGDRSLGHNTTVQLYIPRDELAARVPELAGLSDEHLVFNVTRATLGSMVRWLAVDLSGQGDYLAPNGSGQLIYPADFFGGGVSPPLINILGEAANITATLEAVAASMTKFGRDRARASDAAAASPAGETQVWIVHIKVQWRYLALPAAVLLAGCAVTLGSVLQTRKQGLPAWRGSVLVTLARGLDEPTRAQMRAADCAGVLADEARRLRVALVDADMGPQLTVSGAADMKGLLR